MSDRGIPLLSGPPPPLPASVNEVSCRRCNKEFNVIFTRPRRCNHCGYSYCHTCTDFSALMPRTGPETGYESMNICGFCQEYLSITAMGRARLKGLSLSKLRNYTRAYNIRTDNAVEKDDLIDAILAAKGANGCLSPANEAYYRKHSVPNKAVPGRPRGLFSRGQASNDNPPPPPTPNTRPEFARPDLAPDDPHPPPPPPPNRPNVHTSPRPPPQQPQQPQYNPPPQPPPQFNYPQYHPPPPRPHSSYNQAPPHMPQPQFYTPPPQHPPQGGGYYYNHGYPQQGQQGWAPPPPQPPPPPPNYPGQQQQYRPPPGPPPPQHSYPHAHSTPQYSFPQTAPPPPRPASTRPASTYNTPTSSSPPNPPPRPRAASHAPPPTLSQLITMSKESIGSLSISALKQILHQNHVNAGQILEKSDLVQKVVGLVEDEKLDRERARLAEEREERERLEREREREEERERERERARAREREREEAESRRAAAPAGDNEDPDAPSPFPPSSNNPSSPPSQAPTPPPPPHIPVPPPPAHVPDPEPPKTRGTAATLERTGLCVVCQDEEANIAIVDCGHMAMCRGCSDLIMASSRECPLCRTRIVTEQRLLRIFKT